MLQSVLNNLKNMKPAELAKGLREGLSADSLKQMATQVADTARHTTEEELRKVVKAAADMIIAGRNDVTAEVKEEVTALLNELEMSPRGLMEQIKESSHFLKSLVPKSVGDVKNLRANAALGLVEEAQRRIAARKADEVVKSHGKHAKRNQGGHSGAGGQGSTGGQGDKGGHSEGSSSDSHEASGASTKGTESIGGKIDAAAASMATGGSGDVSESEAQQSAKTKQAMPLSQKKSESSTKVEASAEDAESDEPHHTLHGQHVEPGGRRRANGARKEDANA